MITSSMPGEQHEAVAVAQRGSARRSSEFSGTHIPLGHAIACRDAGVRASTPSMASAMSSPAAARVGEISPGASALVGGRSGDAGQVTHHAGFGPAAIEPRARQPAAGPPCAARPWAGAAARALVAAPGVASCPSRPLRILRSKSRRAARPALDSFRTGPKRHAVQGPGGATPRRPRWHPHSTRGYQARPEARFARPGRRLPPPPPMHPPCNARLPKAPRSQWLCEAQPKAPPRGRHEFAPGRARLPRPPAAAKAPGEAEVPPAAEGQSGYRGRISAAMAHAIGLPTQASPDRGPPQVPAGNPRGRRQPSNVHAKLRGPAPGIAWTGRGWRNAPAGVESPAMRDERRNGPRMGVAPPEIMRICGMRRALPRPSARSADP